MSAYTCDLDKGQQIYIEYQEPLTMITLVSGGASQQQSQRNSFETGNWLVPPTLFRTLNGVVLRIETEQNQHFIQVQASGIARLNATPVLGDAEVLPLQKVGAEAASRYSMPNMQPMSPMPPMSPMTMHMGNMEMRMGEPLQPEIGAKQQPTKNFCNQCGTKIGADDRFCSHCGNRLAPANS